MLGKKIVSTHSRLLNKGWSSMIDFNACQIVIVYLYPLLDLNLQFVQKKNQKPKKQIVIVQFNEVYKLIEHTF